MDSLSKLVIGFLAGIAVYHCFLISSPEVIESTLPASSRIVVKKVKEERGAGSSNQSKKKKGSMNSRELATARFDLLFSDETLNELESNWNDLPLQAEATRERRGWRMLRVEPTSHFFRLGFRDGDLITRDFLDPTRFGMNGGVDLALRVEQVLNRISR